ncbi:zinc-binding dehydrogenase, partial [Aquipuribacter hungaricus]
AARRRALDLGAVAAVDPGGDGWQAVGERVRDASDGGTHVSLDALGSEAVVAASLAGLRPRGRHVQVGLLPPVLGLPRVPLHLVVAGELEVLGSHGMAAHAYPALLALVASGRLRPGGLSTRTLALAEAGAALAAMAGPAPAGVSLVEPGR